MKLRAVSMAVTAAVVWGTQAEAIPVTTENTDIVVNTKGGLEVKTVDKKFAFKVGGRLQVDEDIYGDAFNFNVGSHAQPGDTADNLFFRRARIEFGGIAFYDWHYEFDTEFNDSTGTTGSNVELKDVFIAYDTTRPLDFPAEIRVGRFKPNFAGGEELISDRWTPFIERSAPTQFFAASERDGVDTSAAFLDMFTFGTTYFRPGSGKENTDGGDFHGYAVRGTFDPIHKEGKVLHFGVGYQDRELSTSTIDILQEVRQADHLTYTLAGGSQRVDQSVIALETTGILGPFSLTGEYYTGWINPAVSQAGTDKIDVDGLDILGRWTLTGESLPWDFRNTGDYRNGKAGQIKPTGKWGAFELALRYSELNLDDPFQTELHEITAGLNWYPISNVKLAVNYVHTDIGGDAAKALVTKGSKTFDSGDAVAVRAQFTY